MEEDIRDVQLVKQLHVLTNKKKKYHNGIQIDKQGEGFRAINFLCLFETMRNQVNHVVYSDKARGLCEI